jgi:hypothetical protein
MKSMESVGEIPRKERTARLAGVLPINVLSFPLTQEKKMNESRKDEMFFIIPGFPKIK